MKTTGITSSSSKRYMRTATDTPFFPLTLGHPTQKTNNVVEQAQRDFELQAGKPKFIAPSKQS